MRRWSKLAVLCSGPVLSTGILAILVLKTGRDVETGETWPPQEVTDDEPVRVPLGKRALPNPEAPSDEARAEYVRDQDGPEEIEDVLKRTAEATWPVRVGAVKRLAEMGTEASRSVLIRHLEREKNPTVRSEVFLALARYEPGLEDPHVREAMARELKGSRMPKVINTILHVLSLHGTPKDLEMLNDLKQRAIDAQVRCNVLLAEKYIHERSQGGT